MRKKGGRKMRKGHAAGSKPASGARKALIAVCLLISAFSAAMFVKDIYRAGKEDAANRALQDELRRIEAEISEGAFGAGAGSADGSGAGNASWGAGGNGSEAGNLAGNGNGSQAGSEIPARGESGMLLKYERLWQKNNDLAGWLSIDGTPISYPVMYTPDDPEYYLRRGFDKTEAVSGSLFISGGCEPDSSHVIIYGHQMKNKTMFGSLSKYADAEYFREHPVICFDTLYERGVYEVMAAFYSRAYTINEQGVFRYYQYTDLSDRETFEDYINQVKKAALYDTGISAEYGDSLLTLSTCSHHVQDGRFVVVARKKK